MGKSSKMTSCVFRLVANALSYIAKKTKITYNEINIIVYYFIIPFTWLIMLDYILKIHYLKAFFIVVSLIFLISYKKFSNFSDWLFKKSVNFLNSFNRFGISYVASSVLICVLLPIIIYTILIFLMYQEEVNYIMEHNCLIYVGRIRKNQLIKCKKLLMESIHYDRKLRINKQNEL